MRKVVTGMGLLTSIGNDEILLGITSLMVNRHKKITQFDVSNLLQNCWTH